ncbi:MAG: sigma-70 family RNA polymerase sigma factor [Geminicoccaceae bacterium]
MDFLTDLESCIPGLRRYARALLRDSQRADDLVQDCLERALSRRHLWRGGGSLRPWLFKIMHNINANQARSRATRPVHQTLDGVEAAAADAESQTSRLALRDMAAGLETLPEEQRRVVLLVALEGLSYQEIAEVLEVPIGTVMSRLSRARDRLRLHMAGESPPTLRRVK